MTTARAGGIALIVFSCAFVAMFALEALRVPLGFDDGDNPEQSIAFLRRFGRIYEVSGLVQIGMSVALTIGSLALAERLGPTVAPLAVRSCTAFGLFSAAAYFLNGALRLAAARPLLYIDGLRHEWGITAYLIVQMVGVQGFAQAGLVNFSFWAIGISRIPTRLSRLPRAIVWLGAFPLFHVVMSLFGSFLGRALDSVYPLYIASFFGTILWCFVLGVALVREKPVPVAAYP